MGKTIELKYEINIQNSDSFKEQIPFRLRFRDLNSRQQMHADINLKNAFKVSDWSSPIKDIPIEVLPAASFGPILLGSSRMLKVTLPGKAQIKSIYVISGNKKIFYKKLEQKVQNEKEEVSIEFPKTLYPTLYSIFIETASGSIHENIFCIQTN